MQMKGGEKNVGMMQRKQRTLQSGFKAFFGRDRPVVLRSTSEWRGEVAMVEQRDEVPSSAAMVRAGRNSRTPFPSSLQVGANESSSDEEWDEEDEDSDSDDEDGGVSNVGRGRVRLHAAQLQTASALNDEDERRKCLADKGWESGCRAISKCGSK